MIYHCDNCHVGMDEKNAKNTYSILRFDNGVGYAEMFNQRWGFCSLKCVIQFAKKQITKESDSA